MYVKGKNIGKFIKLAPGVWRYIAYGLLCFFIFLYINLPFKKIEENTLAMIEDNISGKVTFDDRGFLFPLGFRWSGVRIDLEGEGVKGPLKFDEVRAGLDLFPLLMFKRVLSFRIGVFGGEIEGKFSMENERYQVQCDTQESLKLTSIFNALGENNVGISGKLSSRANISFPEKGFNLASGDIYLNLNNVELNNIPSLPDKIEMSEGKLRLNVVKGLAVIKELNLESKELKIEGGGKFKLNNPIGDSNLNIKIKAIPGPKADFLEIVRAMGFVKKGAIPINIKGSFSKPVVKIAGVVAFGKK